MTTRITVRARIPDASARNQIRAILAGNPALELESVSSTQVYTIDAKLSAKDIERSARALTNQLAEEYSTKSVAAPAEFTFAIEVGLLPGVTDNVGATARETIEDLLGRKFKPSEMVYSSRFFFLQGKLSVKDAEAAAATLYNPLIERARIFSFQQFKKGAAKIVVPKVHIKGTHKTETVDLDVSSAELEKIGKQGIQNKNDTRRGPLSLSVKALKAIREHFKKIGRKPFDVELEALAQTWSEHCKHTIFADPLDEVTEGIYRRYIKGATVKIREQKGKDDFCVSVFTDNSGAIVFDDDYLVTHKVETHNSPSALDPFGGAVTGIVGVNRDSLGFGLGARPIANVYGFCVADPNDTTQLFRDKAKKQPLLSARRILEGVVKGVNAGGNQSGIPTPMGFVAIEPRFRGKPLVFAGTVGMIPKKSAGRKLHEKSAKPGDFIVMLGGRVGLDGIHGATFSSEALASGSPATAVQIGDPITQKKLSDAIVREARDEALYSSITDNGAGGLSSSIAEMARDMKLSKGKFGGCIVELDQVPLKYPGLAPWQIWISESQERMTLAVPPSKWKALKKIFDRHDVEVTKIGVFTDSGRCVVRYARKKVMDLDMEFLHDGRPVEEQKGEEPKYVLTPLPESNKPLPEIILSMLSRPNVGSTAFIAEQYDYEVQSTSVTKPLQGRGRVNADAAVMAPRLGSDKGIVLSQGLTPWYSDIDTYAMAAASIDTAVRNAICAGASRNYLAILDNFCWSSSNEPERLWELKRAAEACYDVAVAYGTPFISGKDSMFNDFRGYTKDGKPIHVAAPPTLLVSSIGVMNDVKKAMTFDFKNAGDTLYVLGDTNDELGASEYAAFLSDEVGHKVTGQHVPKVDVDKNAKLYDALSSAIQEGLVASAMSVGRGGLAMALTKCAIAGKLGAEVQLAGIPGKARGAQNLLFSESQGRVIVSVPESRTDAFEKGMHGVSHAKIGVVSSSPNLSISIATGRFEMSLEELTEAYRTPFRDW